MTWGLGMVYYAHSKSMKQNFTRLNLPLLESDDLLAHLLGVATCIYIYTYILFISRQMQTSVHGYIQ